MEIPVLDVQLNGQDAGKMPQLGFGTYKITSEEAARCVAEALETGYRHVDTAQMYCNEKEVGQGLKASGLPREDYYLTTKLNNGNHLPADVASSFDLSLQELGVDYVDLFLIHWPLPTLYGGDFVSTWLAMLEIWRSGRARAVGVSNFEIPHLERLQAETGILPAVNQIEVHPRLANNQVRQWCQERGIIVQAWSPLARGRVFTDETVLEVARQAGRLPGQVALRWAVQRGDVVIPKSTHRERMEENFNIFDFQLDDAQMAALNAADLGEAGRTGSHPNVMEWLG